MVAVAGCTLWTAGCDRAPVVRLPAFPTRVGGWASSLPPTHEPLSALLTWFPGGQPGTAWGAGGHRVLDSYLAALARTGPRTRPDLFPSDDHVLAYLVDAHIAWMIALSEYFASASITVRELRDVSFPLDCDTTTLHDLEAEIARRAPYEPRLALFLNPGWRGGPPLPECALRGDLFDWQLTRQAQRCGAGGFWAFDAGARRLTVSSFVQEMWGLPDDPLLRVRTLLDLVPPPAAMRNAVVAACGASLDRCTLTMAAIDPGRLLTPVREPQE
jgi:hypothetical protein